MKSIWWPVHLIMYVHLYYGLSIFWTFQGMWMGPCWVHQQSIQKTGMDWKWPKLGWHHSELDGHEWPSDFEDTGGGDISFDWVRGQSKVDLKGELWYFHFWNWVSSGKRGQKRSDSMKNPSRVEPVILELKKAIYGEEVEAARTRMKKGTWPLFSFAFCLGIDDGGRRGGQKALIL